MSVTVKLSEVVDALESASQEHSCYLDTRTAEIILLSSEEMQAAEDDELISQYPDWQRESILQAREVLREPDCFLALPGQFEIHEYKMVEDFCRELEDRQVGQDLLRLIKGSGAFRRFKNAIREMDVEKDWYEFKGNALERVATEWLEEHRIPYSRDDRIDVSEKSM